MAVLALTTWLYEPMLAAPRLLHHVYRDLSPRWPGVAAEWRSPEGGEGVLPPKARLIIGMLREHGVREFRYGADVAAAADESLPQRLAEGAYPIALRADARHVIVTATNPAASSCVKVDAREGVLLVHCP